MPPLSPAQRRQGAGPPTPRKHWRCPRCDDDGWAQDAHAAYLAGTGHYERVHDADDRRAARLAAATTPRPAPVPESCSLIFRYLGGDQWAGECACLEWTAGPLPTLAQLEHAHRCHTIEAAAHGERRA